MAKLTKSDVEHVANLAKLDLTDKEKSKYLPQLASVIDYISELSEVDTKNVNPPSQTTGLENVARQDEVENGQSLPQEQATSGTDELFNGYFKVDAILGERSDK